MDEINNGISTKSTARMAGLRPYYEWTHSEYKCLGHAKRAPMVPRRDAEPMIVKGEAFYAEDQCEPLLSRTAAKQRGLKLRDDAEPVTVRHAHIGMSFYYDVYRESDFVPVKSRKSPLLKLVDLLAATFAVNKAAKRCRENAKRYYGLRIFSFASHSRRKKEQLYDLKKRGIVAAYRAGRLEVVGMHGGLGIYRGEGYCFHSPIVPASYPIDESTLDSEIFVEASPRERSEGRLLDAIFTLEQLSGDSEGFVAIERKTADKQDRCRHYDLDAIMNEEDDHLVDDMY